MNETAYANQLLAELIAEINPERPRPLRDPNPFMSDPIEATLALGFADLSVAAVYSAGHYRVRAFNHWTGEFLRGDLSGAAFAAAMALLVEGGNTTDQIEDLRDLLTGAEEKALAAVGMIP